MSLPKSTTEVPCPYDMSIHSNPDAVAWARFFVKTWEEIGKPDPTVGWMQVWFANAMMAMHDFIISDGQSCPECHGDGKDLWTIPCPTCAPGSKEPAP